MVASVCEEEQGLYVDEMFWLTSLSDCNWAQGRAHLLGWALRVADWWMYFSRQETVLVYSLVSI